MDYKKLAEFEADRAKGNLREVVELRQMLSWVHKNLAKNVYPSNEIVEEIELFMKKNSIEKQEG